MTSLIQFIYFLKVGNGGKIDKFLITQTLTICSVGEFYVFLDRVIIDGQISKNTFQLYILLKRTIIINITLMCIEAYSVKFCSK